MPKTRAATSETQYLLPLRVRRLDNGRYLGRCSALPGLNVEGESVADVLAIAPEVARDLIAAMRSKGVSLPRSLEKVKAPANVRLVVAA